MSSVVVDGDLFLRSHSRVLKLRGATAKTVLPDLLSLLDGTRSVDDLEQALQPAGGVREVLALLDDVGVLADAELLERHRSVPGRSQVLAFFDALGVDGMAAADALGQCQLSLLSVRPELAEALVEVLRPYGLGKVDVILLDDVGTESLEDSRRQWERVVAQVEDGGFDERLAARELIVAVVDRWSPSFMGAINRAALRCNSPLMPLYPSDETECLLGPTVVPGETACWRCMEIRMRSNWLNQEPWKAGIERDVEVDPRTRYLRLMPQAHVDIALRMLAVEAVKWLAKCNFFMRTLDQVVAIKPFTLEVQQHQVLKLPRCPDCSRQRQYPATRVWMEPR